MTDRELVLQRWPDAHCRRRRNGKFRILTLDSDVGGWKEYTVIGSGPTEEAAWQSAERNLEVQRDK